MQKSISNDTSPSALISETFANKLNYQSGQTVQLPTPAGLKDFTIAGVFRDYTSDGGVILADMNWLDRYWDETGAHGLALYLEPDVDVVAMVSQVEEMS